MGEQKVKSKEIKIISAVFRSNENKILLVKRGMVTKVWPGKWHVVSGKLEEKERDDDCLKREVLEEVSISNFNILRKVIYNDFQVGNSYVVSLYLLEILDGEITLSEENTEYKWVNIDDLKNMDITPAVILDLEKLDLF